jgi:oxygen-dependent protoporphyrinogen oxidase
LGDRVAVIGAGIAGLTAAYTLKKAGHHPVVFEGADYVGGRIKSFQRGEFLFDVGAFIYLGSYQESLDLMLELGLGDELGKFNAYGAMPRDGKLHYLDLGKPIKTILASGYISIGGKFKLLKLLRMMVRHWGDLNYSDASGIALIDNDTVASYCERELTEELYDYIAAVVVRGPWLTNPKEASLGQLLWTLKNFFKPYFYGLSSGMNALPLALAKHVDVRLNSYVAGVEKYEKYVELSLNGGEVERFDRAIITSTAPQALEIYPQMDGEARTLYESTEYICSVNTHIALAKRPDNNATYIMTSPKENLDLCGVIVDHLKADGRAPEGKGMLTTFCRDEWCRENLETPAEDVLKSVLQMIRPYYGDLTDHVADYEVARWPRVVPKIPQGRFKSVVKYQNEIDPNDRVQLAGDIAPMGGVNAALVSGRNTALAMIRCTNK